MTEASEKRRRWTQAEDDHLRWFWGVRSVTWIGKQIGRCPGGVYERAQRLGLSTKVDTGCVSVFVAARRMGVDNTTMMRILEWANVEVERLIVNPRRKLKRKGTGMRYRVDLDEAREAMEKWLRCKPVAVMARNLGVSPPTLRIALMRAGVEKPAANKEWRVEPDIARQALALHRQKVLATYPATYQRGL